MFNFDKKFLQKLQKQEANSFEYFYNQSVDIFFRYIKGNFFIPDAQAKDLLSDFYVKIRENLPKIDINKNFNNWIWTSFKNFIKDYFKKHKETYFTQLESKDNDYKFDPRDNIDISDNFHKDFLNQQIQKEIKKLDQTSQDILFLRHVENIGLKEIANILGLSYDNVRQKYSRAIKKLKKLLQQ